MVYNSRNPFHKHPFGAVAAGTPVTFRLCLPLRDCVRPPRLAVFLPGKEGEPFWEAEMTPEAAPGGERIFSCEYTPREPGLLFYRFRCFGADGTFWLGRDDDASALRDSGRMWQLTVFRPGFSTPASLEGAVFYQIFPDRFACSGQAKEGVPPDRRLHGDWKEAPDDRPGPDGVFRCDDYFGGDLQGIAQQLPYLHSLGVEVLYLNPIFEAHSNHRYKTADYRHIDPLLGTEEDFRQLCRQAEALGMRVVLDGVFNHTGSDSVYFNKEGRYGSGGAYRDPHSPWHDWFLWDRWPDRYQSWWGFETLPNVNEECPEYQEFICGPQGVVRSWLRAGAAGFRLDVADELPDRFIRDLRRAVKAEGEEKLLLGEVWEDASTKYSGGEQRQYLMGEELDSVMNYPWRTAILRFVREGGGRELENAVMDLLENYPPQVVGVLMNFLSTHDVPRAITALAAPDMAGHDRDWQREHNTLDANTYYAGRQLFLLASVIQYTLPGCPCLYYGDEAGLVGYADPFNRGTYPWGREDQGLVEFFRILGRLRRNSPALRQGEFVPVAFDRDTCTYLRRLGEDRLLICVNRGSDTREIPWEPRELQNARLLLSAGGVEDGVRLCPRSAAVLLLESPAHSQNGQQGRRSTR